MQPSPRGPVMTTNSTQAQSQPALQPPVALTIEQLKRQIRHVELGLEHDDAEQQTPAISGGCEAINRLLPAHGYLPGSLIEWLVPGSNAIGYGAELLSLQLAQRAAASGGAIVIVDPANEFYPPAARGLGIELDRLVIVRGKKLDDLYWSIDQALRCEAVAAVWAAATPALPRFLVDLDERWHRRFQLSAEASGSFGLFLRPDRVARQPSWSDVQWRILPQKGSGLFDSDLSSAGDRQRDGQTFRINPFAELPADYWQRPISLQLLRCRAGRTGPTVHLNFDTRSGVITSDAARRFEFAEPRGVATPIRLGPSTNQKLG